VDELETDDTPSDPPGAPAWMATMGDLMSLLLTFFVLLLTFANMDRQLFVRALGSIQEALGIIRQQPGHFEVRSTSPLELSRERSTPFLDVMQLPTAIEAPTMDQKLQAQVRSFVAENSLSRIVESETSERGVTVRVKDQAIFEPGSDRLRPGALVFLDEVVELAREFPYALSIEGHTDDRPISTERFPSNWHLSASRAISVLRYLVDAGGIEADRLSAAGFADTRPLVPNDSAESRARNRRVEFVFLRDPGRARRERAEERARAAAPESSPPTGDSPD